MHSNTEASHIIMGSASSLALVMLLSVLLIASAARIRFGWKYTVVDWIIICETLAGYAWYVSQRNQAGQAAILVSCAALGIAVASHYIGKQPSYLLPTFALVETIGFWILPMNEVMGIFMFLFGFLIIMSAARRMKT